MIAADGELTKDELVSILKLDEVLPDNKKADEKLNKLADKILEKKYGNAKKWQREYSHESRLKLYNQGLSDGDIAKIEGSQDSSVRYWREKNNLEANPSTRTIEIEKKNKIRMDLYNQGFVDSQIAKLTNTSSSNIATWRKYRKLKSNSKQPLKRTKKEAKNV
jgi:phosphomannomutase